MHKYNDILKELRENSKLTQKELGRIFNLTQRQISTYEVGRNEPEYDVLKQYATYFNVSTDYILGLTKDPTPRWTIKNNITNSFNNNSGSFGDITIKWGIIMIDETALRVVVEYILFAISVIEFVILCSVYINAKKNKDLLKKIDKYIEEKNREDFYRKKYENKDY